MRSNRLNLLRRVLVAVLWLPMALVTACQSSTPGSAPPALPLDHLPALHGDYFELQSRAVGRPFHIYVRLPADYHNSRDESYPAVYLLDGDSLFPVLATSHLLLNYDEGLPDAIIVGVAYGSFDPSINKREFDFSAPARDANRDQGGAPAFEEFLRTELVPAVEERYRADPSRRILFGQSRGGYMVLYSAFSDPDLFWGRIASNPSFDPGRERFYASAAVATRNDLKLVVTSGSRDFARSREAALDWFEAWRNRRDGPWTIKTATIEGGTHSADSPNSYRLGMSWLFDLDQAQPQPAPPDSWLAAG